MKNQTLYRIAVSVLFLLFGSLPASAQSHENLIKVQVPFEFQVDEKLLPAGKYVIRRDPQAPKFLRIQSTEQNILVIVNTIPLTLSKHPARTSLIFKKYDEKYFLSEVKVAGRGDGYALFKSKTERRLAQIEKAKTISAAPNGATTNN
ncbi:MAG: hypothetical protein ACREBD_27525 [Blastocatellia bacterium]